jgi:ParB family chromosome partitioning protein
LVEENQIEKLAQRIVSEGLSVRDVEEIVASGGAKVKSSTVREKATPAPRLKEIADHLSDKYDTRVTVELGKSKGKVVIEFADKDDLERINKLLA